MMNPLEWEIQIDFQPMLDQVLNHGDPDPRKLYAFACHCCTPLEPLLAPVPKAALQAARNFYLYRLSPKALHRANAKLTRFITIGGGDRFSLANTAIASLCGDDPVYAANNCPYYALNALHLPLSKESKERVILHAFIFKSLFRNPHHPWIPKAITQDIQKLAQATDEDPDTAPILADALEEAGETDLDVLFHLRGPYGGKYKGDYVIETILGHNR